MTQDAPAETKPVSDISIVTVCYNAEAWLEQAMRSVLDQRGVNVDYFVVDGGSSDQSLDIIKSFGSKARYLSEPDRGIYDALNKGLAHTHGDIVGFLNADDFYPTTNVLRTVVDAFRHNPDLDIVYGDLRYVSALNEERIIRHWVAGEFSASALRWGWMPPHPSVFVRRSLYQELGGFNIAYKISGDYDFTLRAFGSGKYKALYIPKDFVHMRTGGISNTGFTNLSRKSYEDWTVARSHGLPATVTVFLKLVRKLGQLSPLLGFKN